MEINHQLAMITRWAAPLPGFHALDFFCSAGVEKFPLALVLVAGLGWLLA